MKMKLKIIRNMGDLSRWATIWNWFGFILSYFRFPERIEALSLFGSKSKSYPPSVKVKLLIFKFQVSKLPLFTSLKIGLYQIWAFKGVLVYLKTKLRNEIILETSLLSRKLSLLTWTFYQFGNTWIIIMF